MRDVSMFDEKVKELLKTIKGVEVCETLRPDGYRGKGVYLVFSGNDTVPGAEREYEAITGQRDSAVIHPFSVQVVAPNEDIRNKVVKAVRDTLIGVVFYGSSEIRVTGASASHGDYDASTTPVRYTYMLTFKVTWDLGE